MEIKTIGQSVTVGDMKGGELITADGRTGIVVKDEAAMGFTPNRTIVDITNGERVEVGRNVSATLYAKAKVTLE